MNNEKQCAWLWPLLCFLAKSRCCSNCEMQCAPDQKVSEEMREVEWFRPSSIFRGTWHALMFSLPSSGRELGQMHNGPPAFSKQQCLLFPQEQMQPPQSFQLCWNKRFSNCFCILSTLMDETDECSLNLNHFYCQIQTKEQFTEQAIKAM